MANAAGFIQESIWRDDHWRTLSRSAQALYMQLLSQKELDCAGVLPLQPNKWAKGCDEITVEQVWCDLEELQRERFVFFDVETDEAFVRTYIRNSNVIKVPNMRKSARRSALLVGSEAIKLLLAEELRATEDPDCIAVADQINPSGTVSEPFGNGSKSTLSKPLPEPTGVGTGVGVTHVGCNSSGEDDDPRPQCLDHEENSDAPCIKCQRRREWDRDHADDELNRKRTERQAIVDAVRDCPLCDEFGRLTNDDGDLAGFCDAHPRLKEAAHA